VASVGVASVLASRALGTGAAARPHPGVGREHAVSVAAAAMNDVLLWADRLDRIRPANVADEIESFAPAAAHLRRLGALER
jgi:hypothetical protein